MSVCVCVRAGVRARMCMFGGDRAEFYIHLKIFYLFMAVMGLCCHTQDFSSCA